MRFPQLHNAFFGLGLVIVTSALLGGCGGSGASEQAMPKASPFTGVKSGQLYQEPRILSRDGETQMVPLRLIVSDFLAVVAPDGAIVGTTRPTGGNVQGMVKPDGSINIQIGELNLTGRVEASGVGQVSGILRDTNGPIYYNLHWENSP